MQCRTSGVAVPVPPPAPGSGAQDPSQIADDVSPTLPSLSPPPQPPAYDIIKGDDHYLNGRTGSQAERPTSRRMTLSNISRVLAQDSARSPRFFPRRPPQGSAGSGQARTPRPSAYCYETLSSCRHANSHKDGKHRQTSQRPLFSRSTESCKRLTCSKYLQLLGVQGNAEFCPEVCMRLSVFSPLLSFYLAAVGYRTLCTR